VKRRTVLGAAAGLAATHLKYGRLIREAAASEDVEADVLVIGAGASGAASAWRLASQGFKVVCLEQGDWLDYLEIPSTKDDWELVRQREWNPSPNVRGLPADYPVNDSDSPIKALMYNAVGGTTLMWSCHAPRFHPSDFKTNSLDGVGANWPLSYWDLEPYYDLNDKMCGISGLSGDPSNPPRSARQRAPMPIGKGAARLASAMDDMGWHWWPNDVQALSSAYGEETGDCNNCGPCEVACPVRAKGSTDVTYWPKALDAGIRLITKARVFEIETDANGNAVGAAYYDRNKVARRVRAKRVIVAANGIGTPRLLQLSVSKKHPNGLANGSGLVGRNLMLHPIALVTGLFDEDLEGYKGITANCITSQEFYETDDSRDYKRGYMVQFLRSFGPVLTSLAGYGVPVPWGEKHHSRFLDVFNHTASAGIVCEDIADPDNRITLDSDLTDGDGIPAPKMTYTLSENSKNMLAHGIESCTKIMENAGAKEVHNIELVEQAGWHLMGTARVGDDPEQSVLNKWNQAHDVPNLYVVDGSAFATAAAVNPTNTLQALALRAADHIAQTRGEL
jgi:choline dehydrogenase-like flavoprotein